MLSFIFNNHKYTCRPAELAGILRDLKDGKRPLRFRMIQL